MADPAKPNLYGWGTYLNRDIWEGENAAGGLDDFLERLKVYDPNAHLVTNQGQEGGSTQRIEYDVTKLPDYQKQNFTNVETNRVYGDKGDEGIHGLWQVPDEQLGKYATSNDTFGSSVDNRLQREARNIGEVNVWGPLVMAAITGGAAMGAIPAAAGMTAAEAAAMTGAVTTGATAGAAAPVAAGAAGTVGLSANQALQLFQGIAGPTVRGDWTGAGVGALTGAAGIAGLPMAGTIVPLLANLVRGGLSKPNTTGGNTPGGNTSGVSSGNKLDPRLMMLLMLMSRKGASPTGG